MATVSRINYNRNPTVEVNATYYDSYFATATVARSTAEARTGTASLLVTAASAGTSGMDGDLAGNVFTAGERWTFSGYVKAGSGNPTVYAQDANTGIIGTSVVTSSEWQRISVSFTATSINHRVRFMISSASIGNSFYLDDVLVEKVASTMDYFDGANYDGVWPVTSQSWSGAAHASTSSITYEATPWNIELRETTGFDIYLTTPVPSQREFWGMMTW